jgi:hypothetical protein
MKKTLSFLLIAALLLGALSILAPVSLAEEPAEHCDCEFVPIIHLSGGHGELTENQGTADEKSYYGINSMENLARDLLPGLDGVKKSLLTLNPDKILNAVIAMFDGWVGPLAMNPDGSSVKQLDRYDPKAAQEALEDHRQDWIRYTFTFDWRQSPIEIADKLNDYVQYVKAHTGHDKVHIESISGSGSVLLAYIDKYINGGGENIDVSSVVIGQSTGFGTPIVGNFLNADYTLNAKNLGALDYLYALDLEGETTQTVLDVMNVLYNSGITDVLSAAAELLPQSAFNRIYEQITRKTYAAWPGMWAWCPNGDYTAAKARLTKGHPEYEQLGFIAKIDDYHYNIQARAAEILQTASQKIKVANMVGYDMSLLFVGKEDNQTSDGMVDTHSASLGAIAADYGKQLPKNYTQAAADGHNHLSLDRKIDASTCALPDYTWFMKGAVHRGMYEYGGWYEWWRNTPKGEDSVFDNAEWPQFIQLADKSAKDELFVRGIFVPVTAEPETPLSFLQQIWETILNLFRRHLDFLIAPWKKFSDCIGGIIF